MSVNCGICVHSSAYGHFCEHPAVVEATGTKTTNVEIARSSSVSHCGPSALLFDACQCLQPACPRHGRDKRR